MRKGRDKRGWGGVADMQGTGTRNGGICAYVCVNRSVYMYAYGYHKCMFTMYECRNYSFIEF